MAEKFPELAKIINLYIQEAKQSKNWTQGNPTKKQHGETFEEEE